MAYLRLKLKKAEVRQGSKPFIELWGQRRLPEETFSSEEIRLTQG